MQETRGSQTPPLIYSPSSSDHDHPSTRESTPIRTPVGFDTVSVRRQPLSSRDSGKPGDAGSHAGHRDARLLDPDIHSDSNSNNIDHIVIDDDDIPLFSSPKSHKMTGQAAPIDIATRSTSVSPPAQQASNLTSALQKAANSERHDVPITTAANPSTTYKTTPGRKDSLSTSMAQWGNGSKPISVTGSNREKPRRESLAGSLVGGMSWGGISVGSWIRDDIIMTGTSPFTGFQSPSFHSSSYLPKLEANFMRDFNCCGVTLPTLHDLLQHYEEAHAQKSPQPGHRSSQADSRAAAIAAATMAQQQGQQSGHDRGMQSHRAGNGQSKYHPGQQHGQMDSSNAYNSSHHSMDMDTIDDMELDDAMGVTDSSSHMYSSQLHGQPFGSQNQRGLQLNLSMLPSHQALRGSQPGTPVGNGQNVLQNNPTVSSVNTPTLTSNPLQAQFRNTPESSGPGTPAELDEKVIGGFSELSMHGNGFPGGQLSAFGGSNDMVNLCIDEPAKRLFSPSGGTGNATSQAHIKLGNSQYGPNSEIARRIREQQLRAGVPDTTGLLPHEEPRPYRCPVIGCEKAYKNQNGLKYHKAHGHNNQQLHENGDGTFSIVDPETSAPYPGTLGMEKEKPYRCEVCGKRYKNLNGLKYHRAHSPPCNPELFAARNAAVGGVMHGQNINVAGVGLPGIGEEGMM